MQFNVKRNHFDTTSYQHLPLNKTLQNPIYLALEIKNYMQGNQNSRTH